jgi:myosin heavy subunit
LPSSTEPSPTKTESSDRPEGWEQVDYEDLKAKAGAETAKVVEARIGRLWGQFKERDTLYKQLIEDQKVLVGRLDEMSKTDKDRQGDNVKAEIRKAAEEGRYDDLATLTEKLVKLNSQERPAEKSPEKAKETKPAIEVPDGSEIMTSEEEAQLRVWAAETDANGQALRPWMNPAHPKHKAAVKTIEAVLVDPDFEGKTALDKMAETDRRMGVSRGTRVAPVLTSNASPNRGNARVPALSTEQRRIAENMGIKPEAYAKMLGLTDKKSDGSMNMSYTVGG